MKFVQIKPFVVELITFILVIAIVFFALLSGEMLVIHFHLHLLIVVALLIVFVSLLSLFSRIVTTVVCGETFDVLEVGQEIATDLLVSAIFSDIIPTNAVPKYIRDIKDEAVEAGIKETRRLQQFLNLKQLSTIITNSFYDDALSYLS